MLKPLLRRIDLQKKLVRDDARKPMQLCLMAMHSCLAHDRASKLLNGGVSVE